MPNLADKHLVLLAPPGQTNGALRRGDIVVFRRPGPPHDLYIKRIVGMPCEDVQMVAGQVYISGSLLEEGYPTISPVDGRRDGGEWWTGPEEYVLLGDNRRDSEDSRVFGPVSSSQVIGRVWLTCWPPRAWGPVSPAGRFPRLH